MCVRAQGPNQSGRHRTQSSHTRRLTVQIGAKAPHAVLKPTASGRMGPRSLKQAGTRRLTLGQPHAQADFRPAARAG